VRAARPIQSGSGLVRARCDQIAEVVVSDLDLDDDLARDHVPTITSLLCVLVDGVHEINANLLALRQAIEKRDAAATTKDALITPKELAAILATSPRQLRRMRAAGELPRAVGTEARPRWKRSDVEAYVAKLKARRA
jgi:predicted DNA-binding transcriptional regulator AlpA